MNINNNFSSPNFTKRIKTIEYIILHYTDLTFEESLTKLTMPESEVSSHYLIRENGQVFRLVADDKVAWHAGESKWKNNFKLNQNSIGIEINNLGEGEFSSKQIRSCIELCHNLVAKHGINPRNLLGHSDIAPDRKIDPGIFFNWELLARNGLGMWYNENYDKKLGEKILLDFGQQGKNVTKLQQNLNRFGYKINITGEFDNQTSNVVRAFKAHFCPEIIRDNGGIEFYNKLESLYNWDGLSQKILDNLLLNYV